MANVPQVVPLALEAVTATANAGLRPFRAGLEVNLKGISLGGLVKNFITLYSNAGNDAGHLGILNPLSPIFDQEPVTCVEKGTRCTYEGCLVKSEFMRHALLERINANVAQPFLREVKQEKESRQICKGGPSA
jgi:hypothetical protein